MCYLLLFVKKYNFECVKLLTFNKTMISYLCRENRICWGIARNENVFAATYMTVTAFGEEIKKGREKR